MLAVISWSSMLSAQSMTTIIILHLVPAYPRIILRQRSPPFPLYLKGSVAAVLSSRIFW